MARKILRPVKIYLVVGLAIIFFLFPFYWMINISIKDIMEWVEPTVFPIRPTLENYIVLFDPEFVGRFAGMTLVLEPVWKPLSNSAIVSLGGTALALAVGVPAAYSMAQFKAGGSFMPVFILALRMFPPVTIIIPIFLLYSALGLLDTHFGMILIYALINVPFVLWLMRSFFIDIPKEISEAALLDGCSPPQVFYKLMLPLAKSGLAVTALFIFLLMWSDFLVALVLTGDQVYTMPVYLGRIKESFAGTMYGIVGSLSVVAILPALIFTRVLQRHLVRGLTFGAIRGR